MKSVKMVLAQCNIRGDSRIVEVIFWAMRSLSSKFAAKNCRPIIIFCSRPNHFNCVGKEKGKNKLPKEKKRQRKKDSVQFSTTNFVLA
jgi:hypothetical protein